VLCAGLTALGGWPLYLLAWVLPWATWFQLVTRVRDLAEHGLVHDALDPLRNTRTIGAGPLARAFVAPYGVNYHLEHHLLVFVPCWKLLDVQALLLAKDLGGRAGGEPRGGALPRDAGEGVNPGDDQSRYSQWPLTSEYDRESFHQPPVRAQRAASSSCV
jgi:fatty acid desaturase